MFEKRSLRILVVLLLMLAAFVLSQTLPAGILPYAGVSDLVMFRLTVRTPVVALLWLLVWLGSRTKAESKRRV